MNSIKVPLKRFPKTELEKQLDIIHGNESEEQIVYNDIVNTYHEAIFKHATLDITIITDLVPEQIYKSGIDEITIRKE